MSTTISGSLPVSSITLALYRGDAAAPRRSEEPRRRGEDGAPLAQAMAEALRSLGWTPNAAAPVSAAAPAPEAASENPIPEATEAGAPAVPSDLPAALAGFAEALMAALRESGNGRGRGNDGEDRQDNGRRAWGFGQAVGVIGVRLERMIDTLRAQQPATPTPTPAPVDAAPPPSPVTEPTPVAEPLPTTEPVPAADAPGIPVDAVPPSPPPPPSSPLAAAFSQLLDALRDNGSGIQEGGDPASMLIDFLKTLSDGLQPAGTSTGVTGLFIRISV